MIAVLTLNYKLGANTSRMDSYVVVFPSAFARNTGALLASNVKKILKVKGLPYDRIWRDERIIVVDAKDPVFASSAIGLLYGIERIAIAKKVGNGFDETVKEMAKVGSSLLLKGDRFFIKVGGVPLGATAGDLELAATSAVIEASSASGALPGTVNDHNRLLYTYVTKNGSYVCIFLDKGLGGLPQGMHKGAVLCCIYDELSALACLETIKCGFDVKIIICHKGGANLRKLAKMTNSILARVPDPRHTLEFFRTNASSSQMPDISMQIIHGVAKKSRISRICIPSTPMVFSAEQIDRWVSGALKDGLVPYTPLGGLEKELYANAKEAGIWEFLPARQTPKKSPGTAKKVIAEGKKIVIETGVNGVHAMLDALKAKEG